MAQTKFDKQVEETAEAVIFGMPVPGRPEQADRCHVLPPRHSGRRACPTFVVPGRVAAPHLPPHRPEYGGRGWLGLWEHQETARAWWENQDTAPLAALQTGGISAASAAAAGDRERHGGPNGAGLHMTGDDRGRQAEAAPHCSHCGNCGTRTPDAAPLTRLLDAAVAVAVAASGSGLGPVPPQRGGLGPPDAPTPSNSAARHALKDVSPLAQPALQQTRSARPWRGCHRPLPREGAVGDASHHSS
jgi:hypothetical protein